MNKKVMSSIIGIAAFSCSITPAAFAVTDSTDFSVTVNPYLNLTLSSADVHLPIMPSSGGTYGSASLTAYASTNNALGYDLNLSIKKDATATAALTTDLTSDTLNVNDGSYPVIPTLATADTLTASAFEASTDANVLNHWGMSINDTDAYKAAVTESTVNTKDGPVADDPTALYMATKLDLETVPGSYSAYLNFELVAKVQSPANGPVEEAMRDAGKTPEDIQVCADENDNITSSGDDDISSCRSDSTVKTFTLYKMQDMSHAICESITTPIAADYSDTPTAQLVDVRDHKVYWVAKLMDGKCWMTQNLDLNLSTFVELTHADTDLGYTNNDASAKWRPVNSTLSTKTSMAAWTYQDENNYPEKTPYSADVGEWYYVDALRLGQYIYIPQPQTPSESQFKQSPYSGNGQHGHVGNYYNWAAATAQNDTGYYDDTHTGEIAPNSICPAGWKLPSIADPLVLDGAGSDDYSLLWSTYFLNKGFINGSNIMNPSVFPVAPFFLVPNGYASNGAQNASGNDGRYISSYGKWDSGYFNYAYFYFGGVSYSSTSNMSDGASIRCVAR